MKCSLEEYAKALVEVANKTPTSKHGAIAGNFMKVLKKNQDKNFLERILFRAEEIFAIKRGGRVIKIETARELPAALKKEIISRFGPNDIVEEAVLPELLAGVRITLNGEEEFDRSFKRELDQMFL